MDEKNFKTKQVIDESDVISFYDSYAPTWDARFGHSLSDAHFMEKRWASFEKILGGGFASGSALELGVGTGVYIERVSRLFNKIIAVDGSANMLEQLKIKLRERQIGNVSTLQSNVLSIPEIESESIDCVYFFGLIEHMICIDEFIREIYRVLRKGGIVIGVTPNANSPWYRIRSIVRGTGMHCSSDRYYTKRDLDQMFAGHGFNCSEFVFWGAVPAGVNNKAIYKFLSLIESNIENTGLKRYLGGITFKFRK